MPDQPRDFTITHSPLPTDTEQTVRDWFSGEIKNFVRNGDRSVVIDRPANTCPMTKIKGAGFRGGPIQFGTYQGSGPISVLFDYEGRAMEDIATGHDGAFVGGMSMQQALTEWRMSSILQELGHPVVPCLGYGSVFDGRHRSWFTVFGFHPGLSNALTPPDGGMERFRAAAKYATNMMLDLACNHKLAGYLWVNYDETGKPLIKDLHPFRRMDPMNMSQLSWVMQVYYGLHILAINSRVLATKFHGEGYADEGAMRIINAVCPQASFDDWDQLRVKVVMRYMLEVKPDFSPDTLQDLLEDNPITARLLKLAPPDYVPLR